MQLDCHRPYGPSFADPAAPVGKSAQRTQEINKTPTPPPQQDKDAPEPVPTALGGTEGNPSPPPALTANIEAETDKNSETPAVQALIEGKPMHSALIVINIIVVTAGQLVIVHGERTSDRFTFPLPVPQTCAAPQRTPLPSPPTPSSRAASGHVLLLLAVFTFSFFWVWQFALRSCDLFGLDWFSAEA